MLEQARTIIVCGIDKLVADSGAEAGGVSASVEHYRCAGIARVAVDSLYLAPVNVEVVWAVGLSSFCGWVLRNAFNKNDGQVPSMGIRFAEDVVARALGGKAPIVAS